MVAGTAKQTGGDCAGGSDRRVISGRIADVLYQANATMQGLAARGAVREITAWNDSTRLNPARGFESRMDDPDVLASLDVLGRHVGAAFGNLATLAPLDRFPPA